MKRHLFVTTALVAALSSSTVFADTKTATVSAVNKKQIEQIIREYLIQNPEVLVEASQALQMKQQQEMQAHAKTAINSNVKELITGSLTVAGNAKGNVTLVEFFDYYCGHCIKMKSVVNELIAKNPNLRVVYKEFPIFGKESEMASKMAIAAAMQGPSQYLKVQEALFKAGSHLNEEKLMEIAKNAGLDMTKLKADMNSKVVNDMLLANRNLAEKMHLMGTPAFVVLATPNGDFKANSDIAFIPGAASEQALQDIVSKASGK